MTDTGYKQKPPGYTLADDTYPIIHFKTSSWHTDNTIMLEAIQ